MSNNNSNMLGLRTVVYMVDDLSKAKDWYMKAFNAVPYYDTPYYVGFNIGGFELGLHPKELIMELCKSIGESKTFIKHMKCYWIWELRNTRNQIMLVAK